MSEWGQPVGGDADDCGCTEAKNHLWELLDAELGPVDAVRVQAHLQACHGCLEEHEVEAVIKALVHRSCREQAPDQLRLRIHEQITTLRVTRITVD